MGTFWEFSYHISFKERKSKKKSSITSVDFMLTSLKLEMHQNHITPLWNKVPLALLYLYITHQWKLQERHKQPIIIINRAKLTIYENKNRNQWMKFQFALCSAEIHIFKLWDEIWVRSLQRRKRTLNCVLDIEWENLTHNQNSMVK